MIDKRLFKLPKAMIMLGMLAGLAILQAFSILGQGIFLAKAIVGSWHGYQFSYITKDVFMFFAMYLLRQVISWFRNWYMNQYAHKTTSLLRTKMLDKVYHGGIDLSSKVGTGNLVAMLLDGIDEVVNYLELIFPKVIGMAIIPWIILIYVFKLNLLSGIILLVVFPILILFMIILGTAAQANASKQFAGYINLQNHFVDALRGLATLKVLGLAKEYSKVVFESSESYRKKTMNVLRIAILSTFALDFFTTLSIAMIAMFLGIGLINGSLILLPSLTILILSPEYFLPIRDFGNDFHATLNGKNAMAQMFDILDFETTPQENDLDYFTWNTSSSLSVNNVSFRYSHTDKTKFTVDKDSKTTGIAKIEEKKENVKTNELNDVSFDLHGYQKIGIIGETGSGKTTLLKLLSGFLTPLNKSDNFIVNNVQLPHLNQVNWQNQITYIPQDPFIFSDSIKSNIIFYNPKASLNEINDAIKKAGLVDFISSLKDGIETKIGEHGRGISGGQKQRIALARVFLASNRKILLFDEPTAHLDIETEYNLKDTMNELMKNHLVLFATHRLHWLKDMDYCLVIKNGKLVEQGTPKNLIVEGSEFQKLTNPLKEAQL